MQIRLPSRPCFRVSALRDSILPHVIKNRLRKRVPQESAVTIKCKPLSISSLRPLQELSALNRLLPLRSAFSMLAGAGLAKTFTSGVSGDPCYTYWLLRCGGGTPLIGCGTDRRKRWPPASGQSLGQSNSYKNGLAVWMTLPALSKHPACKDAHQGGRFSARTDSRLIATARLGA